MRKITKLYFKKSSILKGEIKKYIYIYINDTKKILGLTSQTYWQGHEIEITWLKRN